MALLFGSYSPVVPLDTSWQETIQLLQPDGVTPVDLTGYAVRAQLRPLVPASSNGVPTTNPVVEFTTPGYYVSPPAWPVVTGFSIPTPTNGTFYLSVTSAQYSTLVSPTNAKVKLYWDIKLVNGSYIQPVVSGKVVFMPAVTV